MKVIRIFVVAVVFGLAACGGVENDLLGAISSSDDIELCVSQHSLGVGMWGEEQGIQYLSQLEKNQGHRSSQVAVGEIVFPRLVSEGYVLDVQEKIRGSFLRQMNANQLTDKGRKHFKWNESVCIGDREVSEIIEYTEPAETGGMVITRVSFKYDLEFNDFADDVGLEEVARTHPIDGADGEGEAVLVKTNNGWKPQGLVW